MKINLKGPETMYIIQVKFFKNPRLGPYTNFTLYTELRVKIFGGDGSRMICLFLASEFQISTLFVGI